MHVIWFDRPLPPEYSQLMPSSVRAIGPVDGQLENHFADLPQAQAIIAGGSRQYTPDLMATAPNLQAICRTGIGTDNIDIAAATSRGIAVCNTPDGPTISTAEQTSRGGQEFDIKLIDTVSLPMPSPSFDWQTARFWKSTMACCT